MRSHARPLLAAGLLLAATTATAEIYRWTDAAGKTHFSDAPAKGSVTVTPSTTSIAKADKKASRYSDSADVDVRYNYYDAIPLSRQQLLPVLLQASPVTSEGKKYIGHTDWLLNWHYTTGMQNGLCRIASVKTRVTITYIMPRLGNSPAIPRDVTDKFNGFYARLMAHEEGHADNGVFAAREIESVLARLPGQAECSSLQSTTQQTANAIIEKYKQKDKDYDRITGHGRTQGATL